MKKSLIGLFAIAALLVTGCASPAPSSETPSEVPSSETPSEVPSSETSSSEMPSTEVPSSSEEPSTEEPSSEDTGSEEPSTEDPSSSEEEATLLSIKAALAIDTQPPYTFVYVGEKIRIEDATLTTILGDTAFIQQVTGETVNDLSNMEIQVADWGDCQGTRHIVTVEGVLADVDGHAVLTDAVILEAVADPTVGTYYWPEIDRSIWDGYFNRAFHGYWFSANVQLASLPTEVVAGTSQTFQVVFPGEDNDAANPENPYLIDVVIPAEITANEATYINDWLGGLYAVLNEAGEWEEVQGEPLQVGDFVNIFSMCDYSNYVTSMVFNGSSALNTAPAEIENVYATWAEVSAVVGEYIIDSEGFDLAFSNSNAFSYVLDDSMWGTAVYGDEQNPLLLTAYTYDVDALVETIVANITDAGWDVNNSYVDTDGVILAGNADGLTLYIWLYTDGYVQFYLFGVSTYAVLQTPTAHADAIGGWSMYSDLYGLHPVVDEEGTPTGQVYAHESALYTVGDAAALLESAVAEYPLAQVSYVGRSTAGEDVVLLLGQLQLVFTAADDSTALAFVNGYLGLLEQDGWVLKDCAVLAQLGLADTTVLYNETSDEFVSLGGLRAGKLGTGVYSINLLVGSLNELYLSSILTDVAEVETSAAEEAVITICNNAFGSAVNGTHYSEIENGVFMMAGIKFNANTADEATYRAVLDVVITFLPEGFTQAKEPAMVDVEGVQTLVVTYVNADNTVGIQVMVTYEEAAGAVVARIVVIDLTVQA